MEKIILLSTVYLPPVYYIKQILEADSIIIEKHEHFIKQTYRNRCNIICSNGPITLSIPLVKQADKEIITEKRISYAENWQQQHWRTLVSAYKNSPYFDYFEHEFKPFYENKYEFLFDFNLELFNTVLKIIRVNKDMSFTETYNQDPENTIDLRSLSNLKNNQQNTFTPYYQVFSDKLGFKENLSCIDALFNVGLGIVKL